MKLSKKMTENDLKSVRNVVVSDWDDAGVFGNDQKEYFERTYSYEPKTDKVKLDLYYRLETNDKPRKVIEESGETVYVSMEQALKYINWAWENFYDVKVNGTPSQRMYGFKTATYGRKKHRDNITQLENSVRKMF